MLNAPVSKGMRRPVTVLDMLRKSRAATWVG